MLLQRWGLLGIAPEQSEKSLDDWWSKASNRVANTLRTQHLAGPRSIDPMEASE
jgi:hypothetical protein